MDYLQQAPMTATLVKAGLAAGTTNTFSTTGATVWANKGKAFSKVAQTNAALPAVDRTTGVAFAPIAGGQGAIVVFAFDPAGNVRCSQGGVQSVDAANAFMVSPQFPLLPDTDTPFGYLVIKVLPGAANYVFGTSNLSAVASVTQTFVDVVQLPDRPQIA